MQVGEDDEARCTGAAGGEDLEAHCVRAAGGKDLVVKVLGGQVVGADMTGGKQGFSLSTETVQGLPERESTKVLLDLSRTT